MYIYQIMSNSFGYLDIILLGMIAGFIILRLRSILGRKTGHESKIYPGFAEKEFNIPIELINQPEGVKVKLFPPKTKVRATIPMSVIGNIRVSDFRLIADYNQILNGQTQKLELFIQKKPSGVKQIILEPNEVNYLIRK